MDLNNQTETATTEQDRIDLAKGRATSLKYKFSVVAGRYGGVALLSAACAGLIVAGSVLGSSIASTAEAAFLSAAAKTMTASAAIIAGWHFYNERKFSSEKGYAQYKHALTELKNSEEAPPALQDRVKEILKKANCDIQSIETVLHDDDSASPVFVDLLDRKNPVLYINRKVMESSEIELTDAEMDMVIAHESSHILNPVNLELITLNRASNIALLFNGGFLLSSVLNPTIGLGYAALGLSIMVAAAGSFLAGFWANRMDEFRADHHAVVVQKDPQALIYALATLDADLPDDSDKNNIFDSIKDRLLTTHPPAIERAKRIRRWAKNYGIDLKQY